MKLTISHYRIDAKSLTADAQFHSEDTEASGIASIVVNVPIKNVGAASAAVIDALKSAQELISKN